MEPRAAQHPAGVRGDLRRAHVSGTCAEPSRFYVCLRSCDEEGREQGGGGEWCRGHPACSPAARKGGLSPGLSPPVRHPVDMPKARTSGLASGGGALPDRFPRLTVPEYLFSFLARNSLSLLLPHNRQDGPIKTGPYRSRKKNTGFGPDGFLRASPLTWVRSQASPRAPVITWSSVIGKVAAAPKRGCLPPPEQREDPRLPFPTLPSPQPRTFLLLTEPWGFSRRERVIFKQPHVVGLHSKDVTAPAARPWAGVPLREGLG